MIDRRAALALSALGLAGIGTSARSVTRDIRAEQVELIRAFYSAMNSKNWAFVEKLFSDQAVCVTNDNEWFDWNARYPFERSQGEWRSERARQRCVGPDEIYQYFRHRQHEADWFWSLPDGVNSIFSPDRSAVVAMVKKEKVGGGCWGPSVLCDAFQPLYLHYFDFSAERDEGVVLSQTITEMIEMNFAEMRLG